MRRFGNLAIRRALLVPVVLLLAALQSAAAVPREVTETGS